MKRSMLLEPEYDLLSALDKDLLSCIVLYIFDALNGYIQRHGFWSHHIRQNDDELSSRYDRLQPYNIFMVNHELKEKLDFFAHRERFRALAIVTSYRMWIPNTFYKRLLLPKEFFFRPGLACIILRENELPFLLKRASPNAIKLVHDSLMLHWKEAGISSKKSWKVMDYIENPQRVRDRFSKEEYKKILLVRMKYPLIETCQCRLCFDYRTLNEKDRLLLHEYTKRERRVLCENREDGGGLRVVNKINIRHIFG